MWRMECEDGSHAMPELAYSLRLIVSGSDEADVAKGWENLRELESSGMLGSSVNLEDAHSIMRGIIRGKILNFHQVPKLMAYFAKYVKKKPDASPDDEDPIVNDYIVFVKLIVGKDITLLASMVDILKDHTVYGGVTSSTARACRAIVECLGSFQMPKWPVESISEFRSSVGRIRESLRAICKSSNGFGNTDLITVCLETVYSMISDDDKSIQPGPGLVAVLELVEERFICQGVKWIMSESKSDAQLERALKLLCHWVTHWLRIEHLSMWIMEFIDGLETAKKYRILNRVAEMYLGNIIGCIKLPMSRSHATLLAIVILSRQPNHELFDRVAKSIEEVFDSLAKCDSDDSRKCLQSLVNVTKALIERFAGYGDYDSLEKSFPLTPESDSVAKFRDESVWSDDYERFPCREIPIGPMYDHGKVGLTNLGNTCYMNSVLQALAMTRQFSQEVMRYKSPYERDDDDDETMTIASSAEQAAQIMPKLQNLFALLNYSSRRSLSPTEILVASRPEYFTPKQQQDSSEFLCHLLDVLYEQEKSLTRQTSMMTDETAGTSSKGKRSSDVVTPDRGVIKRWTTEEDLSEGVSLERKTSQSLGDFSQGDEEENIGATQQGEALSDCHSDSTDSGIQSVDGGGTGGRSRNGKMVNGTSIDESKASQSILVHRVFGGESKITYQCAQCDTSSHNTDKFRDLQLCFPEEITDNQEVSVQDLMNYYLTPEKLTGDNKYRCDKCMKLCDAQRIIKILRAPIHLILTLKHFHYDPETRLRTKLRHKVTYNETIKLPVSSCDSVSSTSPIAETYRLYAAVVHSGYSMDYGHYVTYARDSKENWYKFNDSYVSRTSLDDFNALEPPVTPYILFYERCGNVEDSNGSRVIEEKPELSELSKRIQNLIENDRRAYAEETRYQTDKKRNQRTTSTNGKIDAPSLRRHDNSDDENPPPSSCRGHIGIPTSRFLF